MSNRFRLSAWSQSEKGKCGLAALGNTEQSNYVPRGLS